MSAQIVIWHFFVQHISLSAFICLQICVTSFLHLIFLCMHKSFYHIYLSPKNSSAHLFSSQVFGYANFCLQIFVHTPSTFNCLHFIVHKFGMPNAGFAHIT